ncbi:hypothetical protein O4160_21025 [Rhodococcus sp. IEGM 1401]|uniref:hypothetical protein n=1 Tax=unclassified Rhodococcus (in: high G+C Gram-positive bacteria) TaxID=192944 RepID=UPI0022B597CF|nr:MULTISPECIES: hypothetical protein [unclassified Rhodococcus (in: high G+C Gram-positive bacteria)]MCZ4563331.1 hypothetical protein [Rhodococcus sp. IEGM 1401]MDI9923454.1 hypothetical protein [Rhodococcus sp. IEGM 1372]MDV8035963.1 hypothetical protein [Rhodococcus sp. IEGM 1414]
MSASTDGFALLRGASVGGLSALVTVAAHTFGGGMPPSDAAIVLLAVVSAAIGYATAAAPTPAAPRAQLLMILTAAQSVGHLLLTAVDGHHHGSILTQQMFAAHVVAILVGALAIRGAEHGIRRAVTSLREALPLLAALVVDESRIAPELPVYRLPGTPRLLDLSGCGNRGPPALRT